MADVSFPKPSAAEASEKISKVVTAVNGDIATFNGAGDIVDSGYTIAKSVPSNALFTDTTYGVVSKSAAGLCPTLPNETNTTKYLRQDGSWITPPNDNTTYSFSNNAPTLAWNTTSTIGTVGGTALTVKLPANPNTNTTYSFTNNAPTLAWNTTSTVGVCGGVALTVKLPANPNTDHYAWSDITGKPDTATRWPAWSEVTGKPNRAGSATDGGTAYSSASLVGNDERSSNYNPDHYYGIGKVVSEFKNRTKVSAPGSGTYGTLITVSPWGDASGGYPVQLYAASEDVIAWRYGTGASSWSNWRTFVTSANIGSQSVNYATSAGNADTVDNEHASAFAHTGAHNNLTASGNEFTTAASGQSGDYYWNYRTAGGLNGNITQYIFGNGKGGTLAYISNGQFSGNAASATALSTSGTIRQYWRGDNTWQDHMMGVLYTGYADPQGKSDKPWHLVADFTQSVNGAQINTDIQLLVYSFYSPKVMGILELSCRWESNATSPSFLTAKWLVVNSAVTLANFVITYTYNSTTKNVQLRFYVSTIGWQTYTFTRLAENSWAGYSNRWNLNGVVQGTYASIPSGEVQFQSTKETLDNPVYWSYITGKPANFPGGCTGNAATATYAGSASDGTPSVDANYCTGSLQYKGIRISSSIRLVTLTWDINFKSSYSSNNVAIISSGCPVPISGGTVVVCSGTSAVLGNLGLVCVDAGKLRPWYCGTVSGHWIGSMSYLST